MPADNGVYSSTATNGKDVYTDPYAQSSPMTSASQPEGDIYSEVTSDNKRMPNVHSQVVKGKDKPTAAVTPINVGEGDVYSIVKPKDKHPASSPAPPLYAVVDKPKEGAKIL